MRYRILCLLVAVVGVGSLDVGSLSAQSPRVLAPESSLKDARLGERKTLNGHFPFLVPGNAGAWHTRAESLRRRVLVATGLWPMPEKTPLEAVIFGKTQRDGFTVEKVYFQSLPGHYVTGLLFRPSTPSSQPAPGVLSPHGHGGRMQTHSDREIANQIAQGAEHFKNSGRTPKLARCAQLARMGCVTFIFDMIGYADSVQIPREVAHRHANPRPEELGRREEDWIFFSPQADLRLQSIMGLQIWNGVRALDFLASLPDVDPDRLAVTGGSGGGTQSILLGAFDDRIKVSFPNGMVSTAMQGGCYCENCNLLRVGTGNVELAALFAPKPQAMTSADDWTKDMMTDGYPELKWLYAMIGNESDVYCRPMLHFKHNYNYVTRATMYQWMNRHLKLGLDDPVIEQDFEPLTKEETTVWSGSHPAPKEVGIDHEKSVCRWLDQQAVAKLHEFDPREKESLQRFREMFGGAWQVIFDQGIPENVTYEQVGSESKDGVVITKGIVRVASRSTEIPLLTLRRGGLPAGPTILWTTGTGKSGAFAQDGQPSPLLEKLLNIGVTVLLPDLLDQGEFLAEGEALDEQRLVDDKRSYSALTFAYNRTLAADRCADLLTILKHAETQGAIGVRLLATDGSAPWAAPAAAAAGKSFSHAVIASNGFRYADIESYRDLNFVPGAVKYGDLPVLFALRSPYPLTLLGENELPSVVSAAYQAADATDEVKAKRSNSLDNATFEWLTQR